MASACTPWAIVVVGNDGGIFSWRRFVDGNCAIVAVAVARRRAHDCCHHRVSHAVWSFRQLNVVVVARELIDRVWTFVSIQRAAVLVHVLRRRVSSVCCGILTCTSC